jgi:hypothetical protein
MPLIADHSNDTMVVCRLPSLCSQVPVFCADRHEATPPPMRLVAILEVTQTADSALRSGLLRAAYEASRQGPVALLLPQGADRTVDRELDAVVAENRFVHGVRYGRSTDANLWKQASRSTVVVAASSDVQQRAATIGAGCVDLSDGLAALNGIGA